MSQLTQKHRRFVRRYPVVAGILTIAVIAAACGSGNSAGHSLSATPHTLSAISVTTFPTSVYLDVWVAERQHFDQKEGVRIVEDKTTGGATLYTPLVGGHADTAIILPEITMLYAAKGAISSGSQSPLVVLPAFTAVATPTHPATALVVKSDISSVAQLAGKTIATHNLVSGFYFGAKLTLASQGLQIGNAGTDAHVTVLPMADMGTAIAAGQIAGGTMDYYTALLTAARNDGKILENILGAGEWKNYPYAAWVFNRSFYMSHPDTVKRFMWSLLDANKWIAAHPTAAKQILIQEMGTDPAFARTIVKEFPLDGFTSQLSLNLADTPWSSLAKAMHSLGVLPSVPTPGAIYEPASTVASIQSQWRG